MARITVEDCLNHESNRFSLVRLAARRAKQLLDGSSPVTDTKGNRAIVSALREIASGKVRFEEVTEQELESRFQTSISVASGSTEQASGTKVAEPQTEGADSSTVQVG